MQLEIITAESKLYSGEVTSVKLPGMDGEFEILNNHAPIIRSLDIVASTNPSPFV